MNKLKRLILILYTAIAAAALFHLPVLAAKDYTPSKVTYLTAKASESTVKLTWKAAQGATGYQIYMKTGANGQYKRIVTVNTTTYTKKKLKNNQTYYFRIRSICSTDTKKYYSTSYSKTVKAKPMVKAPATPTGFKTYQSGNGKVYLSWNGVSGASGYAIYCYNSSTKKYERIARTTGKKYTVTGLTNGKTYKFKLKSYRTISGVTRYSTKYSSLVSVKPVKLSSSVSSIHPMWYKATVTKTVTASPANSSSKRQTVTKGTKVTVVSYGTICTVQLSSGQRVYIRYANLNFTSSVYTTKAYTRSQKEAFVNQNGYSSSTKYLIWVSTYTQQYTLYTGSRGNWKLLRTAKVATGKYTNPTGSRICRITAKEEAWTYDNGTYQAPIVYFYYENAFHSRLHNSDGSIADSTIGQPASSGCVRMYDEDINYIYNNVPIGTTVVIY